MNNQVNLMLLYKNQ